MVVPGPLFQGRFKSIVCQEDVYLKELVRYIHLNPIRAGLVADIDKLDISGAILNCRHLTHNSSTRGDNYPDTGGCRAYTPAVALRSTAGVGAQKNIREFTSYSCIIWHQKKIPNTRMR